MNPFTNALLDALDDPAVSEHVSYWDRAEALIIRVYKTRQASGADGDEWQAVRAWLFQQHSAWSDALGEYWPRTRIGLEATQVDPFDWLLTYREASDFIGDWRAMQTLPAMREAINRWLVDLIEARGSS